MLSAFSVKKPYTVVVAVVIIAILGVVSLMGMTTDLLPSINLPYAVIVTTYIGGSPEVVEMAVTVPIEQRMASVSNIKSISSVSSENLSLVILEFTEATNMDSVTIEMRESLDMIRAYMPEQVGTPMIIKLNPDMMPVMVLSAALRGQAITDSSTYLENTIIPELESVEGVASISASGLLDSYIHVVINEEKIQTVNTMLKQAFASAGQEAQAPVINITKDMIKGILQGQNFSMPAGYITEDGIEYLVRTGDKLKNINELQDLPIIVLPMPGSKPITLKDIADINMLDDSGSKYAKVNGSDAVILTVQKQTEYPTATVSKSLHDRIDALSASESELEIFALMDQGEYIDMVVNSLSLNLIYGAILAILILLLFLRDLRPTIIVGFAIPVSLIFAFVMMYFGKITLNIISMGGLALGVGMLVDNSIVVIENIYRMRGEGKGIKEASIEGAKQVSGAILASTLTTVAVFLPIVFTTGITKQIFTDMGLTIAFSLIASLVIALTLVPMMASGMLVKNINKDHHVFEGIKRVYIRMLKYSLSHKWLILIIVFVLFAGSIAGALSMGTQLFPSQDSGQINLTLELPRGTTLQDTAKAADELTDILLTIPQIETIGASVGGGLFGMSGMGMGGSVSDSVSFFISLKDDRSASTDELSQKIRDVSLASGFDVTVSSAGMDLSALSGGAIVIEIQGREFDTLSSIAFDIAAIVASVEGTIDVSDGIEETSPEIRIVVDKEKSIAKGLTVAQVFMEINSQITEDRAVTALTLGNKDYDIYIKDSSEDMLKSKNDIISLTINSPNGEAIALTDIASVEEASGFMSINRSGQQRYVSVTAELADGYNVGLVSEKIQTLLDSYQSPIGYEVVMAGENRMIIESFNDLYLMLALSVILIYLIMVAQFQSLLSPFIVMFTIPLAFTGGFLGLLISGYPLSIVAFVGLIVLSGVVVNNGIVFIDYVNKLRESGVTKKDALIKAGNDRIRPIFMTALTTIFALSTIAIGFGRGTEMMQPMAVTAIGGLIYATLLTLLVVPVLYDAMNKKDT